MSHFEPFSPIASLSDANCDVGHLDSFEPTKIPDLCSNEFSGMSDVDSCVDNNPDNVCSADKLNSVNFRVFSVVSRIYFVTSGPD